MSPVTIYGLYCYNLLVTTRDNTISFRCDVATVTVHLTLFPLRYLKCEMYNPQFTARFAVIMEAYLKACGKSMLVSCYTVVAQ